MKIDKIVLEEGKKYTLKEMHGFANMERVHDIAYFSYISFVPNKHPRTVKQYFVISADVKLDSYEIQRIYDCQKGTNRVDRMEFEKEHSLALDERARLNDGIDLEEIMARR